MTVQNILYLVGILLGVLLGLISFFGKRLLAQVDKALDTAAQNNEALRLEVKTLTASLEANGEEMKKMRTELSTFRRAFHAFDKWLYGEAQHGQFKNPPPTFPPAEA